MGYEPSARLLFLIKRVQMMKSHYPLGFDVLAEGVMDLHHRFFPAYLRWSSLPVYYNLVVVDLYYLGWENCDLGGLRYNHFWDSSLYQNNRPCTLRAQVPGTSWLP